MILVSSIALAAAVFLHSLWREEDTTGASITGYAGSASCRACHAVEHDEWSGSHHALAERLPLDELDSEAFDPTATFTHGTQQSQARRAGKGFELVTTGPANAPEPFRVQRVLGVWPLRQFLVDGGDGRLQVLEASYDPAQREWFNVFGSEDRRPGEWGHWTGRGMNWNSMCAACHNTAVVKDYDVAQDRYATKMAEMGVGCEACHGPMNEHVRWQQKHGSAKHDPTIRAMTRDVVFDTCGSCHARRGEITAAFVPGESFFDHFRLSLPDEGDVYYPDGQVRDEAYEFSAFLGSKMYAAGVRCVDCHQPHTGKTILSGNALCMRCHETGLLEATIIDPAAHTFHPPASTGSQCVNCHMPQTTYMQVHVRHDHGFTVPDPLLTKQLGIPNACNRCHTDKDADWAIDAVDRWYGSKMDRPSRQRTRTIAAARRGDDVARDGLLSLVSDDRNPYWQSTAAGLLERWAANQDVASALRAQLKHPSPLVRSNALRSLGNSTSDMLSDPSRVVRLEAAWILRGALDPQSNVTRELLASLAHNADQPAGRMQKAFYLAARGQLDQALDDARKAISWDPNSASLRHALAILLSLSGQSRHAVIQLEEARRLEPDSANFRFALALAYSELGQLNQAISELRHTLRLDPRHARAWYNLGLALSMTGDSDQALDALARAEHVDPSDPAFPYARATILARLGRTSEAVEDARRALSIRSDFREARELIRVLQRRPFTAAPDDR